MNIVYKNDKGSIIRKKTGFYVKVKSKEYFIGEILNPSFMNEFGYSSLIDMYAEKKASSDALDKFKFSDF